MAVILDKNGKRAVCAWCKRDVMNDIACFNAKDICVDCCDDAGGCCNDSEVPVL